MAIILSNLNRFTKHFHPETFLVNLQQSGYLKSHHSLHVLSHYLISNAPFLIWLLPSPPHYKYVATLPCNLSLIAQGIVSTHTQEMLGCLITIYCKFAKETSEKKLRKSIRM